MVKYGQLMSVASVYQLFAFMGFMLEGGDMSNPSIAGTPMNECSLLQTMTDKSFVNLVINIHMKNASRYILATFFNAHFYQDQMIF